MLKNIVQIINIILVLLVMLLVIVSVTSVEISKKDVVVSENDKYITVKKYHTKPDVKYRQILFKTDSTLVKFKQKRIILDGHIISASHGDEHKAVIREWDTRKNVKTPSLSCSLVNYCNEHQSERVKILKQYYPKEKCFIITNKNDTID